MQALLAFVITSLLMAAQIAVLGHNRAELASPVGRGLGYWAKLQLSRAVRAGVITEMAAPQRLASDAAIDLPRRKVTRRGRVVFLPTGCGSVLRPYDLVVHFHGAPPAVEPAFERSQLEAALVIINLGIGSGHYESAFEDPGAFGRLLDSIRGEVTELCPEASGAIDRVGLSAWSAGYGAIYRMLAYQIENSQIDTVLLSDGLHAGYEAEGIGHAVNALQMSSFSLYRDLAVSGERLFAITHSAIVPPGYASTTETADFLLSEHAIERVEVEQPGPRPDMWFVSQARRGSFVVYGFDGQDKQAHADQLWAIGDTLFPLLRERWRH